MRYAKRIPPTNKDLSNILKSEGWTKLKEPPNVWIATLLSIPFMFTNGGVLLLSSFYLNQTLKKLFSSENGFSISFTVDVYTLVFIVAVIIFVTIHEFLHACFIPNVLKSDKTYWGINGFFGFVYTSETMRKGRFLIISIMPFFLLSIVLPFVLNMLGWLNIYMILLCLINAMGSCVDMLNIFLVITQVPNSSYIVNNGLETYFK